MNKIFLFLLNLYKVILSPIMGGQCRFYPTCSDYASEAFTKHNAWCATKLTIKRIFRCHPWHPGGIDFCHEGRNKNEVRI